VQDPGGAYFRAAWRGALASKPAWAVVVRTFNERMESTQIEPRVEYGDQFLQLTRQFPDAFKTVTEVHDNPTVRS
jgi:hypothetical protein